MGKSMKEYLLDTNILIYHFADTIPKKEVNKIASNNNLILVTRNDNDFKDIKGLEIYNPFSE